MPRLKAVYSKSSFVSTQVPTRTSTVGGRQGATSYTSNNFMDGAPFGNYEEKPQPKKRKR